MKVTPKTPSPAQLSEIVRMLSGPRRDELESLRLRPSAQIVRSLGLPLVNTLGLSFLPAIFRSKHMHELLIEIDVVLWIFIPASKMLVCTLEELKLLDCDLSCFMGGKFLALV